ncbi:PiggyBac transposable element-derived protein 2 [Plakobranchus ocellatus]|uniref:PiggyBac transposable element-derived protein 2 n=1 Tax=Plakobranchus ocellatus TaxID=259542 RepID=A0AAV3Z6P1_9GAST|nr:PiggyBac transposable element-derived protein 2 [Plakobranchus ocellatus]
MPHAVKEYNAGMGGLDLLDSLISKSKFNMKSRRWYLYIFWHSLQLMVTNAWLVYHRDCDILGIPKKERLILRKIQTRIGLALCYSKTTPRRGRPSLDNDANDQPPVRVRRITQGPVVEVQKDRFDHWPLKGLKRLRCKVCKTVKTDTMCEKSKVNLCFTEARNCFRTYHVHV